MARSQSIQRAFAPFRWAVQRVMAIALAWTALGCGSEAATILAPQDEYMAYRRVRTATVLNDRLRESSDYLQRYPKGRWREQVRPWYERAEAKYWGHRNETASDLAEYLQVLPDGPHSLEARKQLRILQLRAEQARVERLDLEARYTEERLAELVRERERAKESFAFWLSSLLSIDTWGRRTSALDHELLFAWRIDKPKARCVDDRCSKLLDLPYSMPGGGSRAAREMVLEAVILLVDGGVDEARIEGPGLLSRLYEAATSKAVEPGDAQARANAIEFGIDFISGAAEAHLPAARCAVDATMPVILSRSCDGWTLTVKVAESLAEDDVLVIRGPRR
jgi:hypothetical protein